MSYTSKHFELNVKSGTGISFVDITKDVLQLVEEAKINEGMVTVLARHTTAGLYHIQF